MQVVLGRTHGPVRNRCCRALRGPRQPPRHSGTSGSAWLGGKRGCIGARSESVMFKNSGFHCANPDRHGTAQSQQRITCRGAGAHERHDGGAARFAMLLMLTSAGANAPPSPGAHFINRGEACCRGVSDGGGSGGGSSCTRTPSPSPSPPPQTVAFGHAIGGKLGAGGAASSSGQV